MRSFVIVLSALLLCSCASIKVRRANEVKNPDNGIFYTLPENIVVANLIIEEKVSYKGPFAEYAKELLKLDEVIQKNSVEYSVKKVYLNTYSIPDQQQYYFAYPSCKEMLRNISVDDQMILCGYNVQCGKTNDFPFYSYLKENNISEVPFPDACNDGTKKEINDTTYKTVYVDSNFVQVPVLKKSLEAKTVADKAEDAANHLMRVRKRMFKFISGAYEQVPQEGTVEPIVEELKREEQEYLSLFTGKHYTNSFSVKLTFKPEKDSSIVLAWYSEKQGLSAVQKPGFVPVTAEIQSLQHLDSLKKYAIIDLSKPKKGIVYRIPCRTRISLKINNAVISQQDFLISQMGVLKLMPSAVLRKTKNGVQMSPASVN